MRSEELIQMAEQALADRAPFEGLWKDNLFFTQPRKNVVNPGEKMPADLYDSTGILCANTLATGICGYLTNPSSRWFNYSMRQAELMDDDEIKLYLKQCDDIVYQILNASNFYQKIQQFDQNLVTIGSPVLYCEDDPNTVARFYVRGHLECAFLENEKEIVDTMFRWFEFTVRQAYAKWGDKAGKKVVELYNKKQYNVKVKYLHVTIPRYDYDPRKRDNKNMPWASVWVSLQDRIKIAESGYPEFPYFVPRWDKADNSPYAYCPAAYALADLKSLNDMDGTLLQVGKLAAKPPLSVPNDGYVLPIVWKAGAVNYKLTGATGDKIEPMYNGTNIPISLEMTEQRRRRVEQIFFVDLFRMFDNSQMTATEITIRNNQNMLLLGPAIGNVMSECLGPLLVKLYNMAGRAGKLPPIPEKIKGKEFTIEYTSQLARAQKMAQINGLTNTINTVSALIAANPACADVINFDEAVREIADINGNNPKLTNDENTVAKIREDRMQAQMQQQQMLALAQAAQIAKTGADAGVSLKKSQEPSGAAR